MLLKEQDAVYAADKFINYFSNMDRIDEYLRNVKIERVLSRSPLSQFYEEEDTHGMFTAYDMHPEDMEYDIITNLTCPKCESYVEVYHKIQK